MGHKSISMSERYSHLSPGHKKEAVMGMEKAFNKERNTTTEETPNLIAQTEMPA
jgi:hypothetical protein